MTRLPAIILSVVLVTALEPAMAGEMRGFRVIPAPERAPDGALQLAKTRPVPYDLVEAAAQRVVAAWNTRHLGEVLHDELFDKQRLLDALDTTAPRDARMRLLSIGGIQTLQQYLRVHKSGALVLVSRVSATLHTQVEFDDPASGFRRLPFSDEFVFEFRQVLRQ